MIKLTKLSRGFTLVELLVVISIISILSGVLYGSFNEARIDSKNKAMQAELKETQLAIELYKAQNGEYPEANSACAINNSLLQFSEALSSSCGLNPVVDGLIPDFIADLPDPNQSANENCHIQYIVSDANDWYKLAAINCHGGADTAAEGVQSDSEMARCLSSCGTVGVCDSATVGFYESYAVYSAGGECR